MGSESLEKIGYIKLWRCLLDNPMAQKPYYAWLWVVLILKANHRPNKFMWNGKIIVIKEGQLITGRRKLSIETGISQSTIEDILKFLESQHQIQQQKTTKFRLITIVEWEKYQNSDSKSNNKATTKQQQADTNKNDKNDKNISSDSKLSVEDIPFNGIEYITGLINNKRPDLQIIGKYMRFKKMQFPSKKAAEQELRRNLKPAGELAEYSPEQRKAATIKAMKMTNQWTLLTVCKYLNK